MTGRRQATNLTGIRASRLMVPIIALGLILLFDLIFVPGFFGMEIKSGHLYGSLVDILRNSAPTVVLALGMTLVIATGGVDVSVGAVMAISASVACILIDPRIIGLNLQGNITAVVGDPTYSFVPLPVVIIVSLLAAVACGVWNGVLVAFGRIQPLVATLILMIAGRGIAQLITNSTKIIIFNDGFAYIGNGFIVLPFSLFIVVGLFVGAWLLTRRTAIGLFVESVGISFRASFYSGINEKMIKLFVYVFCGFCAGIAGLIAVSSIRTSDANQIGLYTELDAILAVVIGGTILGAGGRFSLLGSMLGALVIQATQTSMYAIGVPASAITAVKAVMVIAVIVLYSRQVQGFGTRVAGRLGRFRADTGSGMMQTMSLRLTNNRKFLPLAATISLFVLMFVAGILLFPAMRDGQSFFNLFITTPFLLILVVGEGLVIISGGIDLSIGGVVALTTVVSAALLGAGWDPLLVFPLVLGMGVLFGGVMGLFITYLKVQPFIATLAGLWLARGLCYLISDSEIRIYNPAYKLLSGTRILIPGLADPVTKTGDYISVLVVVALVVLVVGLFIAHFTRFGRTIYAMGGNNGMNEQSARLMGLRVDRTKVLVYTLSGFCAALAGIAYSIYVGSGHGTHATGMELTVIAAVVIGGMALTGGEGYLIGGLFGVLITALIQSLIQFNGQLSSWWTSIVMGGLMLVFIGVQSLLATWNSRQLTAGRFGSPATSPGVGRRRRARRRRRILVGVAAVIAIFAMTQVVGAFGPAQGQAGPSAACQLKPNRSAQAADLIKAGAVITYERNGGSACVDELYAIYPDGRIVGDAGAQPVQKTVTPADVEALLASVDDLGWFTENMYTTSHTPCGQCFSYFTTVSYQGHDKTINAVDGGTDAPANYWLVTAKLSGLVPPVAAVTP